MALAFQAGFGASAASAHPVPRSVHDRTIVVHIGRDAVSVDYRLDIDEYTLVFGDLPPVLGKADLARLSTPKDFFDAFTRLYAPILADNLVGTLDRRQLHFKCLDCTQRFKDDDGKALDHLRFDFRFRASFEGKVASRPLTFREGNYELEDGTIRLWLRAEPGVELISKAEPAPLPPSQRTATLPAADYERLRVASATFRLADAPVRHAETAAPPPEEEPKARSTLWSLLLDQKRGVVVLLGLAAFLGAAHALTPGHGKTLVAAYLVGERGTVWHALLLGLVTTLTHTGTVLAVALGLVLLFPGAIPADIQMVLGFGGGLLVAGMGFWLLLKRLGGGADHVHLFGGNHRHHHQGRAHSLAGHHHGEAGHAATPATGLGGLIVLGISGGIVPCWDAIAMLGFAVSAQRLWLALPLLLAFSAGLAGVLILFGILVVQAKGIAGSRWGSSRPFAALPLLSAVIVTALGLWLCYGSLHGGLGEP